MTIDLASLQSATPAPVWGLMDPGAALPGRRPAGAPNLFRSLSRLLNAIETRQASGINDPRVWTGQTTAPLPAAIGGATSVDLLGSTWQSPMGVGTADVPARGSVTWPTGAATWRNVRAFVGLDLTVQEATVALTLGNGDVVTLIGCTVTLGAATFARLATASAFARLVLIDCNVTTEPGVTSGAALAVAAASDAVLRVDAYGTTRIPAGLVTGATGGRVQVYQAPGAQVGPQPGAGVDAPVVALGGPSPRPWTVYVPDQLLASTGGACAIGQALAIRAGSGGVNFSANDTVVLRGSNAGGTLTTETFTAVAGAPAAGQFRIGADLGESLANLAGAIATSGVVWTAVLAPDLTVDAETTTAEAVAIVRRTQAADAYPDRLWRTGLASLEVAAFPSTPALTYAPGLDVPSASWSGAPGADPVVQTFGPGLAAAPPGLAVAVGIDPGTLYVASPLYGSTGTWRTTAAITVPSARAGDWASAPPQTASEGIVRLGQAVAGLLGAPIP